jgi:putative serine protease PepD
VFFDTTYTGVGAKILRLTPGEAAEAVGIPAGSVIRSIGGQRSTDQVSAVVRIRSYAPGATVAVVVDLPNNGGTKTFTVKLGKAPSNG